jgi:hypothetical protein
MKTNKATHIIVAVLLILSTIAFGTNSRVEARRLSTTHVVPCPHQEVDSSGAIKAALEAAGQDEVVSLEACTYYLAKPIWVQTPFHGALRGAGKDLTVFRILPGAKIKGIPMEPFGGLNSVLFFFDVPPGQAADITVSDFSIVVTDPAPGSDQQGDFGDYQDALAFMVEVSGTDVNTTFERLRLAGAPGNLFGRFNVAWAILMYGYKDSPMKGDHSISDVNFDNVLQTYTVSQWNDSKIKVTNNTFTNALRGPLIADCSNCQAEITSNKIGPFYGYSFEGSPFDGIGVFIQQGLEQAPDKPSSFLVTGNAIEVFGEYDPYDIVVIQGGLDTPAASSSIAVTHNNIHTTGDGIFLMDGDDVVHGIPTLKGVVSSNRITLDNAFGGIQLLGGRGAIITSNQIAGKGVTGLYMGVLGDLLGMTDFVDSCMLKGNNVNDVVADVAPIWLGSGTSNCTVVGGNAKTNVFDQGVGNVLTGVNNMHGAAPGRAIAEAMKLKMELLKTLPK